MTPDMQRTINHLLSVERWLADLEQADRFTKHSRLSAHAKGVSYYVDGLRIALENLISYLEAPNEP